MFKIALFVLYLYLLHCTSVPDLTAVHPSPSARAVRRVRVVRGPRRVPVACSWPSSPCPFSVPASFMASPNFFSVSNSLLFNLNKEQSLLIDLFKAFV